MTDDEQREEEQRDEEEREDSGGGHATAEEDERSQASSDGSDGSRTEEREREEGEEEAEAEERDAIEFIDVKKSFGRNTVLNGLNLGLPEERISMILGPSGTGKSVCINHMVGLLYPDEGDVLVHGESVPNMADQELFEMRKKFGVLFQDGALFGSMNLYDNTAFPLRQHTDKSEEDIAEIVNRRLREVGLGGAGEKMPNELSGGMRKRAGFARALVLDPEIVLFDEPDSGLDPVRTAYLNQLIVDLNQQIEATFLIVTHDINTARTLPDNIGLLYHRHLAMFGPREMLLTSEEPVVRQFLNAQRIGPIGMAEEKDADELAAEAEAGQELPPLPPVPVQLPPSNGLPRRTQRPPGEWCRLNGVTPTPGSFEGVDWGSEGTVYASQSAGDQDTVTLRRREG